MKKIFPIIMLLAFSACTKSPSNTLVEYSFVANKSASYSITYTGGNGNPVTINFTGSSWNETVSTNKSTGFINADLGIVVTSASPNVTSDISILVNNQVKYQQNFVFDGTNDFSAYAVVF